MNAWSRPIAKWDDVCAELERFDFARIEQLTSHFLAELVRKFGPLTVRSKIPDAPEGTPNTTVRWKHAKLPKHGPIRDALDPYLISELPAFYARHGWQIGNETFGGCICCTFATEHSKGAGGAWVATEIQSMVQCVKSWRPIIEHADTQLSSAFARNGALDHDTFENAIVSMIDVMIVNDWLSESWYHYIDDATRWLINALTGIDPADSRLYDLSSARFSFRSWTAPDDGDSQRFAASAATLTNALLLQNV
jgi:hypothetical protein